MKSRLDELVEEYKIATTDNDESKIKEIEDSFREIGIESLGLKITAFT